jgi:hypothetical protein
MYLCLRFEHIQPAGSHGMAVGRSGCVHSANNKQSSTLEPRSRGKTIKDRLLVIKYTCNCHANCVYLPILHHLHPIEQSGGIDGKFNSELETFSSAKSILGLVIFALFRAISRDTADFVWGMLVQME